jgi:hypothetical protein
VKHTLISCCIWLLCSIGFSQTTVKSLNKKPVAGLTLRLKSTEGTNGAALAWNSATSTYYSVIAGNTDFPIDVFTADGTHIQTITTRMDLRGFWHNPTYSLMEGNTYDYRDVATYLYQNDGRLDDTDEPMIELYELPIQNSQANMVMDIRNNKYVWFDYEAGRVKFINLESGKEEGEVILKLPEPKASINSTSIGYTGVEGAEYALLNYQKKMVYLFNRTNGALAFTMKLPKEAITSDLFRFAYANDHIWLYDVNSRSWTGYQAIK